MDLTVQQLRYFIAVAEELHFTRAAERLCIAAPSLSQQIAVVERRMRLQLFHRTSRHVELTAAGAELLPLARRAVGSVEEIISWAGKRRDGGLRLRIGQVVGYPITSAILAAAARRLPELQWEIRRIGFTESLDAVRTGAVDAVLVPGLEPPSASGVRAVPLWREDRVLVVSAGHRLARRRSVGIDETNDERFLALASEVPSRAAWFIQPRSNGAVPRIAPPVGSAEDVLDLCSAGLGASIVGATTAVGYTRPDIAFIPITDIPDSTVYLLRPDTSRRGPLPELEDLAVRVARREAERFGAREPDATA